ASVSPGRAEESENGGCSRRSQSHRLSNSRSFTYHNMFVYCWLCTWQCDRNNRASPEYRLHRDPSSDLPNKAFDDDHAQACAARWAVRGGTERRKESREIFAAHAAASVFNIDGNPP